jgi:hypothetical protein
MAVNNRKQWKKAVTAYTEDIFWHLPGRNEEESHKTLVRTTHNQAKI